MLCPELPVNSVASVVLARGCATHCAGQAGTEGEREVSSDKDLPPGGAQSVQTIAYGRASAELTHVKGR
jgi:hypothetical protein